MTRGHWDSPSWKTAAHSYHADRPIAGGQNAGNDGDQIEHLAKLSQIDYGRARKEAAKQLGIPVDVLDKEVKERRKADKKDSDALTHWQVVPWENEVARGNCWIPLLRSSAATLYCRNAAQTPLRSGFYTIGPSTQAISHHS